MPETRGLRAYKRELERVLREDPGAKVLSTQFLKQIQQSRYGSLSKEVGSKGKDE